MYIQLSIEVVRNLSKATTTCRIPSRVMCFHRAQELSLADRDSFGQDHFMLKLGRRLTTTFEASSLSFPTFGTLVLVDTVCRCLEPRINFSVVG